MGNRRPQAASPAFCFLLVSALLLSCSSPAHSYCIFNGGTTAFTFYQNPVQASSYKIALNPGEWGCCGWYNSDCNFNDGACGMTGFGINKGYQSVDSVTRSIIAKAVFSYIGYALSAPFLLIPGVGEAEFTVESMVATVANIAEKADQIAGSLGELGSAASINEFASLAANNVAKSVEYLVYASINKGVAAATGFDGAGDIAQGIFRELGLTFQNVNQDIQVGEAAVKDAVDTANGASQAEKFLSQVKSFFATQSTTAKTKAEGYLDQLLQSAGFTQQQAAAFKAAGQQYIDFSDKYWSITHQLGTIYNQINNAKRGWYKSKNQTQGADTSATQQLAKSGSNNPDLAGLSDYNTVSSSDFTAGTIQVPNAAFITVDSNNFIQWCWQVYSCDGVRDFMAETGPIGGFADDSSSGSAHLFNTSCFYGCIVNGMDAFGNTEKPNYYYRRSGLGPYQQGPKEDEDNTLYSNGCCWQSIQAMQNSAEITYQNLKTNNNLTAANLNTLKTAYAQALAALKQEAPYCFLSEQATYVGCVGDGKDRVLSLGGTGNPSLEACFDQTANNAAAQADARNPDAVKLWFGVENGGECYFGHSIGYAPGNHGCPGLGASNFQSGGNNGDGSGCKFGDGKTPISLTPCTATCGSGTISADDLTPWAPTNLEHCGGNWALGVWSRNYPPDHYSANYSYIGCYNDIPRTCNGAHGFSDEDPTCPGNAYDAQLTSITGGTRPHMLPYRPNGLWWYPSYGAWNYVNSVQECADIAMDLGYPYFGVQLGYECWLGFDLRRAMSMGPSNQCQKSNCKWKNPNSQNPLKYSPDSCGNGSWDGSVGTVFVNAIYQIIPNPPASPPPPAPAPPAPPTWCTTFCPLGAPRTLFSNGLNFTSQNSITDFNTWVLPTGAHLDLQHDGNLVLYDNLTRARWSTATNGKGSGPYKLTMQTDGNLVLYSNGSHASAYALWSTQSNNNPQNGPFCATFQTNDNLAVFDSRCSAVWTSGTAPPPAPPAPPPPPTWCPTYCPPGMPRTLFSNGANFSFNSQNSITDFTSFINPSGAHLDLQSNGLLVIYSKSNKGYWGTGTTGRGSRPYTLVMQTDGNLVLYDNGGHASNATNAIWSSATQNSPQNGPFCATFQTDDNFVVYNSKCTATWASNTLNLP